MLSRKPSCLKQLGFLFIGLGIMSWVALSLLSGVMLPQAKKDIVIKEYGISRRLELVIVTIDDILSYIKEVEKKNDDVCIKQDRTSKKNCYSCDREMTLRDLIIFKTQGRFINNSSISKNSLSNPDPRSNKRFINSDCS